MVVVPIIKEKSLLSHLSLTEMRDELREDLIKHFEDATEKLYKDISSKKSQSLQVIKDIRELNYLPYLICAKKYKDETEIRMCYRILSHPTFKDWKIVELE